MGELVIQNVNVVLPDRVLENGSVRLQDQLIQEVSENPWLAPEDPDGRIVDGQDAYLLPGFIDIHSDNIETVIQPRPQSMIDFELAMREQEKQLVCQGITTMYHSLTIMDTNFGGERVAQKQQLRSPENLTKLIGLIRNFHEGDHLIRHRFHCRYEITNTRGYSMLLGFIRNRDMQLLSFMDHTPGQGQYRNLEFFKNHVMSQSQTEEEKKATEEKAEAGKAEAINQVRTGVEVAWLRTQNAINQYKLSASTVKLASENLKLKSKSFDEGLATALDVNEARNQLFAAEVGRRVAAFEFVSNYAMLHAIAGQMSEFMNAVNKHEVIVEN